MDAADVLILRYGTRTTTRSDSYLNYHLYGEPDSPQQLDYYLWAIRGTTAGTIVVDTGFSRAEGDLRGRTTLIDPLEGLAACGIAAEDVRTIVLTHLHYDHAGNVHRFPNAEVVVAATELEFWRSPIADRRQFSYFRDSTAMESLTDLEATGRLRTFGSAATVATGVTLIEIGGHTPGQTVVRIAGTSREVVLASDASHFREELERDMPFMSVSGLPETYLGLETLRGWRDAGAEIVSGHDPAEMTLHPALVGHEGMVARVPLDRDADRSGAPAQ